MREMESASLLLALDTALVDHGSWAGETHMQKAVYCAQALLQVPFGFDFVIYKHGPYSFELADELAAMRANGFLEIIPRPPYGPSLQPGPRSRLLANDFNELVGGQQEKLVFIARALGQKNVAELERIATLLYVQRKWADADPVQKLVELKPHVRREDATTAATELAKIQLGVTAQFGARAHGA